MKGRNDFHYIDVSDTVGGVYYSVSGGASEEMVMGERELEILEGQIALARATNTPKVAVDVEVLEELVRNYDLFPDIQGEDN